MIQRYSDHAANERTFLAAQTLPGPGERLDVMLAVLLKLLGCALCVYLAYTVISRL